MKCNVDSINKHINHLQSVTDSLSNAIAGSWDDEVKASYKNGYISACKSNCATIKAEGKKLKSAADNVSQIDPHALIEMIQNTGMQIGRVVSSARI